MTQQRTHRTLPGIAAAAVLIATACAPSGGPSASSTTTTQETPVAGGRVIRGSFSDIRVLNPVVSTDATSTQVISLMYDTLINVDPKTGTPVPWMGKWTVSADNQTFSWEIDAKANWSDGKPVIAEDFLARAKATARSKLTTQKSNWADVEGFADYRDGKATAISGITIDTANPKKFTVHFTRSFCPALLQVFGSAPIPSHVFGKYTVDNDPTKNIDTAPENAAPAAVSGPFKFKEWRKGDQVILSRNDGYWRGAPFLDDLLHEFVEVWRAAPVTVVTAQDDLIALAPFLELERAADRGRRRILGRGVDVLGGVVVDGVLTEDMRRDRRGPENLQKRGAEGPGEMHGELLRVCGVDRDAGDRRRLPIAVIGETLDVRPVALLRGELAARGCLGAGEEVLGDDRLTVGPVRLGVDLPREGLVVGTDCPLAHP